MATSVSTTPHPAITREARKARFAELLATKVAQGYDVESQGETEAVITSHGRRRLFRSQIAGKRQHIAIDVNGAQITHRID